LADGKIVPHGIYDVQNNRGYLTLGISKDPSEFACEAIKSWWINYGISLNLLKMLGAIALQRAIAV
jgi:hypothetical protein